MSNKNENSTNVCNKYNREYFTQISWVFVISGIVKKITLSHKDLPQIISITLYFHCLLTKKDDWQQTVHDSLVTFDNIGHTDLFGYDKIV